MKKEHIITIAPSILHKLFDFHNKHRISYALVMLSLQISVSSTAFRK